MIVAATDHWTLEGRADEGMLELVRTRREFDGALDIEVETDALVGLTHSFEARHGLMIDMRSGVIDDRPQLESAARRFLTLIGNQFERVAVVVGTHSVMHRVSRLTNALVSRPLVTLNYGQAEDFARGMKSTGARVRPGAAVEIAWAVGARAPVAVPSRRPFPFPRDEDEDENDRPTPTSISPRALAEAARAEAARATEILAESAKARPNARRGEGRVTARSEDNPTEAPKPQAARPKTESRKPIPIRRDLAKSALARESATTSPPPEELPNTASNPTGKPRRGARMSSLSGVELARNFVVEELAAEVEALALKLESWAMVREKVIAKLDIRGARLARSTAGELRKAIATLKRSAGEAESSGALYAEIQELRGRAEALIGRRRTSAPPRNRSSRPDPYMKRTRRPV